MSARVVNLRVEDLKEHPQASIVPDMQPDEWDAFLEDVRVRDVQVPIVVCQHTILDGRHRVRAQKKLHVDLIPAIQVDLPPAGQLDYLIRAAILRRHLNESQRAMLAARLKPAQAKAAKASESKTSAAAIAARPEDSAGSVFNVSGDSVARAEKIVKHGAASLGKLVDDGKVSVSAAAVVAEALPKVEQAALVKEGPKAVVAAAKKIKEKKSKIAGGTEFPVDQIEAANDAEAKEDRTDSLNGTVPDDLVDVFSQCRKWQQAMNAVSQAKKTVTEFKDHRAAMFLDFQELDRLLTQARVNLKFAMPYTECPKCRRKLDKKCPQCKGQGWLNKSTFTACASDADKAWLSNRKQP